MPTEDASDSAAGPESSLDLAYTSRYDLLGLRAEVATNSAAFRAALDRLNAGFLATAPGLAAARYEAVVHATDDGARLWEITFQAEELGWHDDLVDAASHVEWHLCGEAIERRHDLLHVHGAALATPEASVLLPGRSGIGKTTLALALALARGQHRSGATAGAGAVRGLRMLSDDVVFIRPESWLVEPFPRAFHVHDDALARLAGLGLRYAPEDHVGRCLSAGVLGPWDATPGPPVRYVVFPRLEPGGALALEPITGAEAALELLRYSKNLRRFPRFGLDLVPRLLEHARCYVLRWNEDLAAAAGLISRLICSS